MNASVIVRSTGTPTKHITQSINRKENFTVTMHEKSTPKPCPTLTYSVPDFLAKASALRESGSDSTICEALSSLRLPESLQRNGLHFYFWKTSPACYRMTAAGRLIPSSPRLLKWGIISNGVCITANISESHSNGGDCILSDILNQDVPDKYFLSPAAMRKLSSNLSPDRKDSASTKQTE